MTQAIRILLIDDQTTIRQALQMLLEREPGFEIVGGAPDGESGLKAIEELGPDVVLVDIEMPGIDGIETAKIIHQRYGSQVQVLILTGQDDQSCLQRALQAGAKGYLLKTTPADDLIYAIRAVKKGYSQVSPGLIEKMMASPAVAPLTATAKHTPEAQRQQRLRKLLQCMATLQEIHSRGKSLQSRITPLLQRGQTLQRRLESNEFCRGM
ncbi:MAG: response regulator transcription factor [Synechococcales cyanobacterium RU_4_20]|nr:response regulator transcription factor [Synechococcales cyanobacterium RU_4_20]